MSNADPKTVVRRLFETINEGRLDQLEDCFAPDLVNHDPLPPVPGDDGTRKGILLALKGTKEAFPDFRIDVEQMIGEGDRVAVQLRAKGTQRGEFAGQAPTNQPVSWEGLVIFRIENGKIAERWAKIVRPGAAQPNITMMPTSTSKQPTS